MLSLPAEMALIIFFIGFFSGLVTTMSVLVYLLSARAFNESSSNAVTQPGNITVLPEDLLPADENPKKLSEAVHNSPNLNSEIRSSSVEVHEDNPTITMYKLEQNFYELSDSSKERGKELKTFASFLSDIGRTYTSFSRDLAKLSLTSRSKIKLYDKSAVAITSDASPDSDIAHNYYSDWWKAFSLFLDHTSDDAARLAEIMSEELAPRILNICEDLSTEDKKLILEGSILLTQLKDSLMNNEPLLQERDKWRVKVSAALIVPTGIPIIGGMSLIQSEEESIRRVQRLQACELALLENMNRISECKSVFRISMSNILKCFRESSSLSTIHTMQQLINLGDILKTYNDDSNRSIERFISHIFAVESPGPGTVATAEASLPTGSKVMLQTALEGITSQREENNRLSSTSVISTESVLDTFLESTTYPAVSARTVISPLHPSYPNNVGSETCVWFNAFSSRVYKDAVRSEYFHSWLQETLTKSLNRGKKPGFIDEFKIESLVFGPTPPTLFNVQLTTPSVESANKREFVPKNSQPHSNRESNSNKESTDSKCDTNYHSCKSSYGDDYNTNINSSTSSVTNSRNVQGKDDLEYKSVSNPTNTESKKLPSERNKNEKSDIKNSNNSNEDKRKAHENCGSKERESANSLSDENVECSADLVYKSGIKFKVSTR